MFEAIDTDQETTLPTVNSDIEQGIQDMQKGLALLTAKKPLEYSGRIFSLSDVSDSSKVRLGWAFAAGDEGKMVLDAIKIINAIPASPENYRLIKNANASSQERLSQITDEISQLKQMIPEKQQQLSDNGERYTIAVVFGNEENRLVIENQNSELLSFIQASETKVKGLEAASEVFSISVRILSNALEKQVSGLVNAEYEKRLADFKTSLSSFIDACRHIQEVKPDALYKANPNYFNRPVEDNKYFPGELLKRVQNAVYDLAANEGVHERFVSGFLKNLQG